jgi:hypothetical protein
MAEIRCELCGRRYKSRSGLRRHMKAEHGGAALTPGPLRQAEGAVCEEGEGSFDTPATRATQDAEGVAAQDDSGSVVERALAELGIEWKNVMAFGVHGDRVVIIEGPVGYKRTWWMPETGGVGLAE